MRFSFLLLLLILTLYVQAQDSTISKIFPLKNGVVYYEQTIVADSISKNELYKRVTDWIADLPDAQKETKQVSDRETGFIAFKSVVLNPFRTPKILGYSVEAAWEYRPVFKVYVSDSQARITVTDIVVRMTDTEGTVTDDFALEDFGSENINVAKSLGWNKSFREKMQNISRENLILADNKIRSMLKSLEQVLMRKETNTKSLTY